jgi:hypothetical protein
LNYDIVPAFQKERNPFGSTVCCKGRLGRNMLEKVSHEFTRIGRIKKKKFVKICEIRGKKFNPEESPEPPPQTAPGWYPSQYAVGRAE